MRRVRTRLSAAVLATTLGAAVLVAGGGAARALSTPAIPQLSFDHTISSHPFSGAPANASDIEGLGYVAGDTSMWVADDNADSVWEINSTSGAYKTRLRAADFETATQVGTGLTCSQALDAGISGDTGANECHSRTDDFESVVYDANADVLYVTSGGCCSAGLPSGYPKHPTVWKLTRQSGHFAPTQWQALDETQDPTAAGWRPGTGIYFGKGTKIKTYDFATNALGSDKSLSVSNIVGIDFTDASTAFVTTASVDTSHGRTTAGSDSTIHRFDISGSSWTENTAWKFPLKSIGVPGGSVDDDGMIDARDLAIVSSGGVDRFYVSDGYDYRASGDHPIYVYTLGSAPGPTASFTAVPTTGRAPFTVQFTDTSIGAPTSWAWDFDNNGTTDSTLQNPTHNYATPATYTAKLTATNAAGSSSATQKITVNPATALPGGYTLDGFGGLNRFRVGTGPLPPRAHGAPYWLGWDIARGATIVADGTGGYVLDGFGGLNRFRVGSGARPPVAHGGPYWLGWDIARGVAVLPDQTGGYIVDGFGGIHPFAIGSNAKPPKVIGNPYWLGQDMARGISITPDGKGGYVVDRNGHLHPFKIGSSGTAPAAANGVWNSRGGSVRGVGIIFDGSGGFTLSGYGGLHPFGIGASAPPPAAVGNAKWPTWNIARGVALMPDV